MFKCLPIKVMEEIKLAFLSGIRHLQCALLKVALVLGVQFYCDVAFQSLKFPEIGVDRKGTMGSLFGLFKS